MPRSGSGVFSARDWSGICRQTVDARRAVPNTPGGTFGSRGSAAGPLAAPCQPPAGCFSAPVLTSGQKQPWGTARAPGGHLGALRPEQAGSDPPSRAEKRGAAGRVGSARGSRAPLLPGPPAGPRPGPGSGDTGRRSRCPCRVSQTPKESRAGGRSARKGERTPRERSRGPHRPRWAFDPR